MAEWGGLRGRMPAGVSCAANRPDAVLREKHKSW